MKSINSFGFRGLIAGICALSLAGCATTVTTTPPDVTTQVTTGVTNVITDLTPVLPSNVQSVVTKIQSVVSKACGYVPLGTSLINLVNTNGTVTTVGDIANSICNAYHAATSKVSVKRKLAAKRGGSLPLTILVNGVPVTGNVVAK